LRTTVPRSKSATSTACSMATSSPSSRAICACAAMKNPRKTNVNHRPRGETQHMTKTKTKRAKHVQDPLGRRFHQAFLLAARMHSGQTRKKTTIPYIAHLMSVSALVIEAGCDEDVAIAALLHDVVEDCGGRPMLNEVRRRFGPRVADIVEGCTDSYG